MENLDWLLEELKCEPEEGVFFKMYYGRWNLAKASPKTGRFKVKGKQFHGAKLVWWFQTGFYPTLKDAFGYRDGDKLNLSISNLVPLWDTEDLTQDRLKELFDYDKETGHMMRRYNMGGQRPGVADSMRKDGYWRISIFGKRYLSHRIIWFYHYGKMPENEIDHINHNRDDNRLDNLRDVTSLDNSKNMSIRNDRDLPMNVYLRKAGTNRRAIDKYEVNIEGKHIGSFDTIFEATIAAKYARVAFGYHANHGVV